MFLSAAEVARLNSFLLAIAGEARGTPIAPLSPAVHSDLMARDAERASIAENQREFIKQIELLSPRGSA
jgi:hypothetical protein